MATDAIHVFAPAKINLFLHVGARRDDGYHELQSLMAFANVGDDLLIEPAQGLSLAVDGPFATALESEAENIVLKAARALAKRADVESNAKLALTKNLPVASGLGGGSSDAAAALRGLCKLWRVNLKADDLQAIAAALGADVPACLNGRVCWAEGIGEKLSVVPIFPAVHAVLVNPGIAVSTAEVFQALETRRGTGLHRPATFADVNALLAFLKTTHNDLQAPATRLFPGLDDVMSALCEDNAILLARMSGSGATCFGLCSSAASAAEIAHKIANRHPHWWVKAVRLGNG